MRKSLNTYCRETGAEALLEQWDQARNAPMTPEAISYGSKQKVWWRCSKGHIWQAPPYARTSSETGCPYCTGRRAWPGESDLQTLYPALAAQWDSEKNGALTPADVLPGSHRKVWWRCEKGHNWQAQVKSRVNGCGCPICANRELAAGENDLLARYPELAAQWHPTKNGTLTPDAVQPGSNRKVWWLCEKGHEWQATVASRASGGSGCPVCAGKAVLAGENDLATQFPQIAAQWHPTKNGTLQPAQLTSSSNRKVWWRCPLGHAYQAVVAARTAQSSGCPYCAGKRVLPGFNDLETRFPRVAAQWHPTLNGTLTPAQVLPGSHRKVWWQCAEGHAWKAVIYSRTTKRKSGCPVCAGVAGGRRRRRSEIAPVEVAL